MNELGKMNDCWSGLIDVQLFDYVLQTDDWFKVNDTELRILYVTVILCQIFKWNDDCIEKK